MNAMTYTEARETLAVTIRRVCRDHVPVIIVQTLLCGGLVLVMAGCVSPMPRNDSESSPLVSQVLAPASRELGGNPGATLMKVTLLSQECFEKNLKRGAFEDKVCAILKETGIESMTIEYADGTKKKITQFSQEQR